MSAIRATSRATKTPVSFVCRSCRERLVPKSFRRPLTSTTKTSLENQNQSSTSDTLREDAPQDPSASIISAIRNSTQASPTKPLARIRLSTTATSSPPRPSDMIANLTSKTSSSSSSTTQNTPSSLLDLDLLDDPFSTLSTSNTDFPQPHRLHIFAHKHNTHITLVQPSKPASQTTGSGISATSTKAADQNKVIDVLLSVSTGNIGFKKSGRGTYDAAYQLMGFVLRQVQERGLMGDIKKIEVALRGFGPGREAVTKALLGAEGRFLRGKVTAVFDATRLKHGGTRGKKPRRLG